MNNPTRSIARYQYQDLDEIYDTFDHAYIAALRALRDTQRLERDTAFGLTMALLDRVALCGSARSIARVTRTCEALIKRYGQKEIEHAER